MKLQAAQITALLGCVLVAGVLAGQAVSTLPDGPTTAAANCTAAQKTKNARALAAYRKQVGKQRAAYFRKHRSAQCGPGS